MSVSDPVPAELLAEDLVVVLSGAFQNNPDLLSPIEKRGVEEILSLPINALRLLARLLDRKGPGIRLDCVTYEEVEKPEQAIAALMEAGVLVELRHGWTRTELFSLKELKEVLKSHGLGTGGKKREVVDRVVSAGLVPEGRVVALLVRDLVRRCEWLFFGVPGVSRKRFLLERMGVQTWMDYAPLPGRKPFKSRDDLLRYERIWKTPLPSSVLVRELTEEGHQSACDGSKFSVRRLLMRRLEQCANDLERAGDKAGAAEVYRILHYFHEKPVARIQRRLALCLDALGRPEEGAAVCQEAVCQVGEGEAAGLSRTGRRLARKGGTSWRPPRPLAKAPVRTVRLPCDAEGWLSRGLPVERAVMAQLTNRRVAWGEGGLWTSLFVLLCFDLLWDPKTGMLPAPCLPGPLDLGRSGFGKARGAAFRARMEAIEAGEADGILSAAFQHRGVRVRGLNWSIADAAGWSELVASLPPKGLRHLLEHLAEQGFRAANGLPDLVVWPGSAERLSHALPSSVRAEHLLVEVKGPSDHLRDEQEGWHHRLVNWGFFVETWRVEELEKAHANYRRAISRAAASSPERKRRPAYLGPSPGGPLFNPWAGSDGL